MSEIFFGIHLFSFLTYSISPSPALYLQFEDTRHPIYDIIVKRFFYLFLVLCVHISVYKSLTFCYYLFVGFFDLLMISITSLVLWTAPVHVSSVIWSTWLCVSTFSVFSIGLQSKMGFFDCGNHTHLCIFNMLLKRDSFKV